ATVHADFDPLGPGRQQHGLGHHYGRQIDHAERRTAVISDIEPGAVHRHRGGQRRRSHGDVADDALLVVIVDVYAIGVVVDEIKASAQFVENDIGGSPSEGHHVAEGGAGGLGAGHAAKHQ